MKPEPSKTATLSVRIPKTLKSSLEQFSKETGVKLYRLVQDLLSEAMTARKQKAEN